MPADFNKLCQMAQKISAPFPAHLIEQDYDTLSLQALRSHKSIKTAPIYTYVLNRGGQGVLSPVDNLDQR
jgi:hypothetical protein